MSEPTQIERQIHSFMQERDALRQERDMMREALNQIAKQELGPYFQANDFVVWARDTATAATHKMDFEEWEHGVTSVQQPKQPEVVYGIRPDGTAWLSVGNPENSPHAACDVDLPEWALKIISRKSTS